MQFRTLGRSGLRVSAVGLGCNNFGARIDLEASRNVIDRAIDRGVTLFDTADIYGNRGGSETVLGEILGARRNQIVLATKFGMPMDDAGVKQGGSRRYIINALEDSLRRLKTDWIDLYQIHDTDPATPIEETLRALDDLIRAGKVRYIGCSNHVAWRVADAHWTATTNGLNRFISAQDEYSLLVRDIEKELTPALERFEMGLLPYFPLASGLLTGKYEQGKPLPAGTRYANTQRFVDKYMTEANWAKVNKLQAFAAARGRGLNELAFAWLLAHPVVSSVIAGATKPEQIDANVKAGEWTLSADELAEVNKIVG